MKIKNKEIKIIKSYEEIKTASEGLAKKLDIIFGGKDVIWMTVMRGGLMFSTEVVKNISFRVELDFISSSSYYMYGKVGSPIVNYDGGEHLKGKEIILIDDVIDSGETLYEINKFLEKFMPASITNITMFGKKNRKKSGNKEIFAFDEELEGFLVGFGLDIEGFYRNLPYVAIIKNEKK